ncbi:MAG: sugar-binding transcriptional regulator [Actinomycetota bacterium]
MMNDSLLKVKAAKLYYEHNLSKIEIGKKLRISRFKVANLLDEAVREGIVTIDIKEPEDSFMNLENRLEEKFKIYRAVVVDWGGDYRAAKKNMGRSGAQCLMDLAYDGDVIGIAWGSTIYEMVNQLPDHAGKKDISVVQLTGGLNQVGARYNAIELASRVAKTFDADCYQLYAPAIVDSYDTKQILLRDSNISRTLEMFARVNIAVVGIGSMLPEPSSMLYKDGYLKEKDLEEVRKVPAVGDINTFFYDRDGNPCETEIGNRTIGMDIGQLKRVRYATALAGGAFKADAIYSALLGKIINILVTDNQTAENLLER